MAKAIVASLLLFVSVPSYSADIIIGIGQGQLARPGGEHWDHRPLGGWDMVESDYTPMWHIGVRFPVSERFGVEARYHDWGKFSQFLGFYPDSESNGIPRELINQPGGCAGECDPTYWGYTDGHARGITLTGTYEHPVGSFNILARGGIAYVLNKWRKFHVIADDPWKRHFDESVTYRTGTATVTAGIGVSFDRFRVEYEYVHDLERQVSNDECCSPHQSAHSVSLSVVF